MPDSSESRTGEEETFDAYNLTATPTRATHR